MSHMTRSLEDYLESIYNIEMKNGSTRVTDLAEAMNVSKPSVNQALIVLSGMGLILYEKYEPVRLTEQGRQKAGEIRRLHTLLKRFLMQTLGVPEDIAENDACRMEHIISAETVRGIKDFMGEADGERPHED